MIAVVALIAIILVAIVATARFEGRGDKIGAYRPIIGVVGFLALVAGVIFAAATLSLWRSVSDSRRLLYGGGAAVALVVGIGLCGVAVTGRVPRWLQRALDWLADQPF